MIKKKARISSIALSGVMIAIIGYLAFSTLDNEQSLTVTDENQSFDFQFENVTETEEDCSIMLDNGKCFSVTVESVIPKQIKITESNEEAVNSFFGLSSQFDQFGVEIVATKYKVNGESHSSSSVLPVNFITNNIVDKNSGFIIDNIQINFNALSKAPYSSFNLEGDVDFFLDEQLIASKKLWVSGSLANANILPIKVVDKIPPPLNDRPETFDFTFTDEGFVDGTEHTFRVVVNSVKGIYTANGVQNQFNWNGEFVAYELNLVVDESNTFVVNEDGSTVAIPKSDSAVIVCARGSYKFTKTVAGQTAFRTIPAQTTELVEVYNADKSKLIGKVPAFTGEPDKTTCKKITGLSRNTEYVIVVKNEEVNVKTPTEHINYSVLWEYVDWKGGYGNFLWVSVTCSEYRDSTHCTSGSAIFYKFNDSEIFTLITTNFGYGWTDRV